MSESSPSPAAVRRALRRAERGQTLDAGEATLLLAARGTERERLFDAAGRVRDAGLASAGRPGVVTYSRKVFIPLTRLCRDRCHYCTFATVPGRLTAPFLDVARVLEIAREGARQGCKEALFTLGDRPEERWPAARRWLAERGYESTLEYVRACAVAVLEETGLLPHLNPGVLSWDDLQRLKPVAPSMGMMLETTATRLWSEPGGPHFGSPDKEPAVRLRVLHDAGRVGVPFTTGILIGIGESAAERVESLLAIRDVARHYGHVQEVIVQNFRAKPGTAMRAAPDADADELAVTVAVARLLLGPAMRLQAPPNLLPDSDHPDVAGLYALLLRAGIDDWGGVSPVTPDHVNPEKPWPALDALAAHSAAAGFTLRERLTVHPPYVQAGEPWLDPRVTPFVAALADPATGLARADALPVGMPWQEPGASMADAGRVDLSSAIDVDGRTTDRRADFDSVYGDWSALPKASPASAPTTVLGERARAALRLAESDPAALLAPRHTDAAMILLTADGPLLDAVTTLADGMRRDAVGETVTYVVNRNVNFTNVCYVGCRFCAFAQRRDDADAFSLSLEQIGDRAARAQAAGATEVCMQGGIDPRLSHSDYLDIVRTVRTRAPGLHVHAFSPMEIATVAARAGLSIRDWLGALRDAGLSTIPGTAAEILDDDVRWVLTRGKLPAATWVEVVSTAHELGLRSSATMMYGHVDHERHWLTHFRVLADVQDRTGGFTEFVPLPFVHHQAPIYRAGRARPGPSARQNLVVHAMARILLHGKVSHVQASWVKLGDEGVARMLRAGADDMGGTLMEETISRMAGSEHGSSRTVAQFEAVAASIDRPIRQRTTIYGVVDVASETS